MKVLYVGGIYPVEYSLYQESQNNPNVSVKFCCGGESLPNAFEKVNGLSITVTRDQINKVKQEFNPDLTIFRTWSSTETLVMPGEFLWSQEIVPSKSREEFLSKPFKNGDNVTVFQSKVLAKKYDRKWLPYCVSKYWGKRNVSKTIPVMVATSLPDNTCSLKIKSMDILIRPIVNYDPSLVHVFSGYNGGLESVDYLRPCMKASYSPFEAVNYISKAKIYISPTTIWYDEGSVSYKTVESMACGVLTITNKYADVEEVFGKDGDTIIYSNSPEETLDKVKYYLAHDFERETIAERGYNFVHKEYSWEKHFLRLKKELGV